MKKMKKYGKDGLKLAATGIGLSVGAQVATDSGATGAAAGIGKMSKALPIVGGVYGAKIVLDSIDTLQTKAKKKGYKFM